MIVSIGRPSLRLFPAPSGSSEYAISCGSEEDKMPTLSSRPAQRSPRVAAAESPWRLPPMQCHQRLIRDIGCRGSTLREGRADPSSQVGPDPQFHRNPETALVGRRSTCRPYLNLHSADGNGTDQSRNGARWSLSGHFMPQGVQPKKLNPLVYMAPRAGLEPATWWLTNAGP